MKKLNFKYKIAIASLFVCALAFGYTNVSAEETVTIHLRIESDTTTILTQEISIPESCEVTDSTGATSTHSGYSGICVLQTAQEQGIFIYSVTDWGFAFAIDSINEVINASDWSQTWLIYQNYTDPGTGINGVLLKNNEKLLITYGSWPSDPLGIDASNLSTEVGNPITLSSKTYTNGVASPFVNEVTFFIDGTSFMSPSGTLKYTPQTEGSHEIYVEALGKTRSEKIYLEVLPALEPEPEAEETQVHLDIRFEDNLFFSDTVTIPYSTSTLDSSGVSHPLETDNVLKALLSADEVSDAFAVTDLQYYKDLISFYLNCIELSSPTTSLCANWHYVVDGIYPNIGMDAFPLTGNEQVYIYFNNPWHITASTSTFELGTTTTFQTWRYNYDSTNTEWLVDGNNLIDISVDNPNSTSWQDLYITIATTTSNELGEIQYLFNATGTYYAKITSDDFSKWSNPITINVTDATEITDEEPQIFLSNPGSGSGNSTPQKTDLEHMIEKAFTFVISQQQNGGFGNTLFSDWVAMAFGKHNLSSLSGFDTAKTALKNYLLTQQPALSSATDYERHTLARSALDLSSDEYVAHILNSFDGTQFGIEGLDNDDIFAILALCQVGKCNDSSVAIAAKHIKDDIDADTSGNLYGVDMTSAGVRALLKKYDKTDSAIIKATSYLKAHQNSNASFGDSGLEMDSTTWTLDTIGALGEFSFNGWTKNNNTPFTYLKSVQNSDGSFGNTNKVWSTAYALIGLAYDWSGTAGTENNEKIIMNNEQSSTNGDQQTTSTPTSTPVLVEIVTSTPTTTLEIGEGEKIVSEIVEEEIVENIEINEEIISTQITSSQNTPATTRNSNTSSGVQGEKIEDEEVENVELDETATEESPQIVKNSKISETPNADETNFPKIPATAVAVLAGGFGVWRLLKYVV